MVLCTISNGRSLKSCVLLVVFCFSLVVVCISPVWAETTSGDPDSFAVYCGYPSIDEVYQSSAAVVPFFGHHTFSSLSPSSTVSNIPINISVPDLIPVSYARTLVLDIGFAGLPDISIDGYLGSKPVSYFSSSVHPQVLSGGCSAMYENGTTDVHGYTATHHITIPANCTALETESAVTWCIRGDGTSVGLVSYGGYVVSSSDRNLVDLVSNILSRVKSIDGNVSSSLAALNQILIECQSISADTASIKSLLKRVSGTLVTLNGTVDNIYTLLKDSLANESAAVDQKSEKLGGEIMQRVDSEQYWSDKNTETFNALDLGNFSFGDGVVSALPVVGNLFKGLWDSFGEATLIITFPLMLGVALVIVGRISRSSGKGSKKGGDDG